MRKRSITLIIGFMSVALLGVMGMQYYFIRESYRLKSQLFNNSVKAALDAVVYKVEKRDADNFMRTKTAEKLRYENNYSEEVQNRIQLLTSRFKSKQAQIEFDFKKRDSIIRSRYKLMVVPNDFYETYIKPNNPKDLKKVQLASESKTYMDALGQTYTEESYNLFVDGDGRKLKKASTDTVRYLDLGDPNNAKFYSFPRADPKLKASLQEDQKRVVRERKILDSIKTSQQNPSVFEDLQKDYEQANIPFGERANHVFIDTLIKQELANQNIDLLYEFQITPPNSNSVLFTNVSDKKYAPPARNMYTARLFPKEMIKQPGILTLIFPDKGTLILQNMGVILLSSASLLLILIGCFAYTTFIILRQKKISDMKTDFINNMTHEFKTPVATIMIASEALKDPEITEDESRIKRLASIIYDENVRLGNHIERVLNIAKIDRDDLRMESEDIDMNNLISGVVDSMELQLQKKKTTITLELEATNSTVRGDELHLSNVLFNLIDNAIKYSSEDPAIVISTHNSGDDIVIRVKDNGIGMNRDQLSKIFDQFYRIPTGNLHDVKGFGLGLSYVNNIVKRLQGSVHVKSEKNKGSEFELIFHTV